MTDKEFRNLPGSGEAYWLILGKAHLQRGIWALQPTEQNKVPTNQRTKYVQQGVEQFTLAAVYFQRYWPGTTALNLRLELMAHHLDRAGLSVNKAKVQIRRLASNYGVDLTAFLGIIEAISR